jgi:hypothetical protein
MTWIQRNFGKETEKKISQYQEKLSSVNGSSKLKKHSFKSNVLCMLINSQVSGMLISTKVLPLCSMMQDLGSCQSLNLFGDLKRQSWKISQIRVYGQIGTGKKSF